MGLFGKKKKKTENIQPEPRPMELLEEYKFEVHGLSQNLDAMYEVLEKNSAYDNPKRTDKPIHRYKYFDKTCEISPDVESVLANSLKVCYDGKKLGYVPVSITETVKMYLDNGYSATLFISPMHYKVYEDDEWVTYKKDPYAKVRLTK